MTTTSYVIAWLVYLGASYGICFIWWRLSANWKKPIHINLTRYLLVVLLLTPYFVDPAQSELAPALLIVLFESVFGDATIAMKALVPLLALVIAATAMAFVKSARTTKTSAQ